MGRLKKVGAKVASIGVNDADSVQLSIWVIIVITRLPGRHRRKALASACVSPGWAQFVHFPDVNVCRTLGQEDSHWPLTLFPSSTNRLHRG